MVEYRVDGGKVIRLLTDLFDADAHPAAELAQLYHERWEAESSYWQIKTFQHGQQEVLRSVGPELVRQEAWAHLVVHHCLTAVIMRLADNHKIDPDRISFVKILKHTRRSVIRQCTDTPATIRKFTAMLAAKYAGNSTTALADSAKRTGTSNAPTRSTPTDQTTTSARQCAGYPPKSSHCGQR
ncbi:hypothetical protein [Streptomyces syringium]|uniref:hypothetical protein n=1 Tax=Streptomyces syringium TaxID=76729 RepID=UPI003455E403